jgi:Sec-independent protein translocase protein TatA
LCIIEQYKPPLSNKVIFVNIFGIGLPELTLILIIMLVVAGPKRMIQWAYILGVYIGKLRNMWAEVVRVLQREFDEAGVDVKIPEELPTRNSINTWMQNASRPYTQPIQDTLNQVSQATDITPTKSTEQNQSGEQTKTENKPSWLPSAHKQNIKAPAPSTSTTDNGETPISTPPGDFGTWGQTTDEPSHATPDDFGAWGQATTTPEQKSS